MIQIDEKRITTKGYNLNRTIGYLLTFIALTGLSSCVSGDGRADKPVISSSSQGATSLGCDEDYFWLSSGDTCVSECPDGTSLATGTDLTEVIATETEDNIQIIENSAGVCVDDAITRPTDEIYINSGYCACKEGLPDIIGNCETYCASQTTETPTLFVTTTLGPNVELNEELGSLDKWCNSEISDGLTGPACFLEVYDGSSTTSLSVEINSGSNSFTTNISSLALDTPYVATLKEKGSGSDAQSQSFQFRRTEYSTDDDADETPLKIMPISQYTCLTRAGTQVDAGNMYDNAARLHYYFASNNTPPSLAPGDPFLFCHDIARYGEDDSPLYDRLELIPQHMALWDLSDVRFADQNSDSRSDINETIQQRLLDEYGITKTINIFGLLTWPNMPDTETTPNMGYYMVPWIDSVTGRAFCPDQTNYNSEDKLFNILKEVVGVSTEGMYMAVKEAELLSTNDGEVELAPTDIVIIRENLLKKIWFYYEDNQHLVPDEITATQKTIHFYWPADVDTPYIKKSTQKIYTVRTPTDLNVGDDQTGIPTTVSPSDKRFGCMPALD